MKRANLIFAVATVPLDYLALVSAAIAAYYLRFADALARQRPIAFSLPFTSFLHVVLLIALVFIAVFAFTGLYRLSPRGIAVEASRVFLAISTSFAAVLAIAFFSRTLFESRFIMLAAWTLAVIFVIVERLALRSLQRSLRAFDIGLTNVAIIGKTNSGNALCEYFSATRRHGYHLVAQTTDFASAKSTLLSLKHHDNLDLIIVANPNLSRQEVDDIKFFADIEHLTFAYSADLVPSGTASPIIHTWAGFPVIEVPKTPMNGWGTIYKRTFDILFSLILIIITLPLQIIIALAIIIENPGPVFFGLHRVGQGGQTFPFLKFRTMIRDAHKLRFDPDFIKKFGNEREGTPLFKLHNDPRVTKIGKLLRAWSLDEIPQFYLVLSGTMSLVGPRPHLPEEVAGYRPEQRQVLTIKPGITGMAQVSGRASLDFADEVRLDMYYIENWSPWLDLIILLKTPLAVFGKTGAY